MFSEVDAGAPVSLYNLASYRIVLCCNVVCCNAVPCRVVSSIYSTVVVVVVAVDRYAVRGIPSLFPLLAGFVYSTMTMTMTMPMTTRTTATMTTATTTAQVFDPVFVLCEINLVVSH